jgi:UDP-glucose 4-epimerase
MKLVLTGSSGLIGRAINEAIEPVANIDRRYSPVPNFHLLDLRERDALFEILNGLDFDCVFHLAANARVYQSVIDPMLAYGNIVSSINVISVCADLNKPVVFASSREVYGSGGVFDEDSPQIYLSPYAWSKGAIERVLEEFSKLENLRYHIIRLSNVYGNCKNDIPDRIIPMWTNKLKNGEDVILYGAGKCFSFTFLDDVVKFSLREIESFLKGELSYRAVNIAGEGLYLGQLFKMLKRISGSPSNLRIAENRPGEPMYSIITSNYNEHVYTHHRKGLELNWQRFNEK